MTTTAPKAMAPKGASTSPGLTSASVAATEKRRSTTAGGRAAAMAAGRMLEERGAGRPVAWARAGWREWSGGDEGVRR